MTRGLHDQLVAAFVAAVEALDDPARAAVLEAMAGLNPPKPAAGRVRWNPENRARLRDAAARLPSDRALARVFGITPAAAKLARQRFALEGPGTGANHH